MNNFTPTLRTNAKCWLQVMTTQVNLFTVYQRLVTSNWSFKKLWQHELTYLHFINVWWHKINNKIFILHFPFIRINSSQIKSKNCTWYIYEQMTNIVRTKQLASFHIVWTNTPHYNMIENKYLIFCRFYRRNLLFFYPLTIKSFLGFNIIWLHFNGDAKRFI